MLGDTGVFIQHRNDIEALRALAVSVVLVFHALPAALPGGFLGVDIFFVVSGYLITLLLITEHTRTGQVSWKRFYTRRIKRLGPALAVTIVGVLGWGWFALLPEDYATAARTGAAAALGLGNIQLGWSLDYFADDIGRNPFGHTWSLGVEEQFYFVWPLMLWWALQRGGWALRVLAGALTMVGFAWAVHVHAADPAWAYFRPDARVWELAAGAWLAVRHAHAPPQRSWSVWWCAPPLVVLCASFVAWDKSYAHPGWGTVPTILATVTLLDIGARLRAFPAPSFLASPVLFLGRISYALYLVHWPVFVFWTLDLGRSFTMVEALAAMGVAIGLAWLLHVCVENPIRHGKAPSVLGPLMVASGLLALSSAALFVVMKDGFSHRVGPDVRAAEVYRDPYRALLSACHFGPRTRTFDEGACVLATDGISVASPRWAVLGDSHATSLVSGLLDTPGVDPFLALGFSGCPLTLGPDPDVYAVSGCLDFTRFALSELEKYPSVRVVVVHIRWSYYIWDFDSRSGRFRGDAPMKDVLGDVERVVKTLKEKGYEVILVGPVPEQEQHIPKTLAERLWHGDDVEPWGVARSRFEERQGSFKEWARTRTEPIVWPDDVLCSVMFCAAISQAAQPLYFDDNHLSPVGASLVASRVWQVVMPLLQ